MTGKLNHYLLNLNRLATLSMFRFQSGPKSPFSFAHTDMSQPREFAEILNAFAKAPESGRPQLTEEEAVLVRLMRQALQPGGASVSTEPMVREQCREMSALILKGTENKLDERGQQAVESFFSRFAMACGSALVSHAPLQRPHTPL